MNIIMNNLSIALAAICLFTFTQVMAQSDKNFIIEKRYITTISDNSATPLDFNTKISYFDGLGRKVQDIITNSNNNIVINYDYDENNILLREYLPHSVPTSSLDIVTNSSQILYDKYQVTNPYSENKYEKVNYKLLEKGFPGEDWNISNTPNHTLKKEYWSNLDNEVKKFIVASEVSSLVIKNTISSSGFYPKNTLRKKIIKNENWQTADYKNNTTEIFTDKYDNTVLLRIYNNNKILDTYYLYNDVNQLIAILPPLSNGQVDNITLNKLCYQYNYDERNRLVEKKLPGKEWEYIVYDKDDRVILTGPVYSPFGSGNKGWLFTKYDAFSRPVYTGYYNGHSVTAANRKAIKDLVYAQTNSNETKTTGNQTVDGVAIRYSNTKFPTSSIFLLTVNYYDDYNFPNAPTSFPSISGQPTMQTAKGLATGSWTRVVTTTAERKATQNYTLYNAKYQPLRTYSKNHLGGYTKTDSELTFTGLPVMTRTMHMRSSDIFGSLTDITDEYTYDQQERLIKHTQKIGKGVQPGQLITENVYDELGVLVSKKVGGLETASSPLQEVDYKYNVRGWLTDINSIYDAGIIDITFSKSLFNLKINYNQVFNGDNETKALYNGNISSLAWRTATDNEVRGYAYDYDHLNRLNYASHLKFLMYMNSVPGPLGGYMLVINHYRTGQYAEDLTYDKNGNILNLDRYGEEAAGQPIQIDGLTYTYDGNRLLKVADSTNNPDGFKDGINTGNDYTYDTMGNMLTDKNKNITAIKYNHLNLPTEVVFNTGKISYIYDATGTRLGKKVEPNNGLIVTTDYLGGFQYKNNQLQFFFQPEGLVEYKNNQYIYHYIYKDHLGNNRLIYADLNKDGGINPATEIIEENNYYPFGLKHKGYNELATENPAGHKYKFQGQEHQDELGLNWDSFKWRNYMPDIGRFFNPDPLSDQYSYQSHYNFSENRVVDGVELEGLEFVDFKIAMRESQKAQVKALDNGASRAEAQKVYQQTYNTNVPFGNLPDETGLLLFRYATPFEDVFGLITGQDFEGNAYHRGEAGVWAAASFIPFAKIVKAGKVIKIGSKQVDNLDDFYKATSKLDVGERVSIYKEVGSEIAEQNKWYKNKNLSKKNNRDIYTDNKGNHYSLDTQHGHFEVLNKQGKHQGSIDFDGFDTGKGIDKSKKHDIIVR